MVRGAQLAAKEINAAGGVKGYKFEIVSGDVRDQVSEAVTSAIEKITADKDVQAMMTGYASTTNFEIKNLAAIHMPYLVMANSQQTREIISPNPDAFGTIWSMTPSFDAYETELPKIVEEWAKQGKLTLKNRKVAVITSDNPYSSTIAAGLKKNFTAIGWKITLDEKVPFGQINDWRSLLAKIRSDPPDLVVNTDYLPANGATFTQQFLENPTQSLLFIQYGPSVPEYLELTKEKSTGILYNMLGGMIQSPKLPATQAFLDKFKAEYGVESGNYGAGLYYGVQVYAKALAQVGDPANREAIGKAIGATELDVPFGHLKFDLKTHLTIQGNDTIPMQFYQIVDGKRVLINTNYATGDFKLPPWMKP